MRFLRLESVEADAFVGDGSAAVAEDRNLVWEVEWV